MKETKTLRVKIPVAWKDKDVLKVKGMGNQMLDKSYGDLYINLNIVEMDDQYQF